MKILHLNTYDKAGGAEIATYRIHKGLQKKGIDSNILVLNKKLNDPNIFGYQGKLHNISSKVRAKLNKLPLFFYKDRQPEFTAAWIYQDIQHQLNKINPDIINLHWIYNGFLRPESLSAFQKPLVWVLHDMWPFTGGCHYTRGCVKYHNQCGACPNLNSNKDNDLSRQLWQRKFKAWSELNITIVSISRWLADCARQSSLFKNCRIEVIPNSVDSSEYKPISKSLVRKQLGLHPTNKLILFGAMNSTSNKRKGFQYLIPALQKLAQSSCAENMELVVFGSLDKNNSLDLGMKATYFGILNGETLAQLYSAADVMVVPSVEEGFGNTTIESLACGTPVVSFDCTGLKDTVEHQKNGYRAECFSSDDLARGITWVLEDEERWQGLSRRSREKVEEEFTLEVQAQAYIKLYEEILSDR
jgi:glycosyltransferase involved in cell wall biosynthesis